MVFVYIVIKASISLTPPLTWVVLTKIGGLSDKPSVWTVSFVGQLLAKPVSLLVIMGNYKLKIGG